MHPTGDPDEGVDDPADVAALARHAAALGDAIEAHLGRWVVRVVRERHGQWAGSSPPGAGPGTVDEAAEEAAAAAVAEVVPAVRALLARDVDEQPTGPLDVVRRAVGPATDALRRAGVPPVVRDEVAERLHPDDVYDLSPGSFSDLHPAVHEPGLTWGAAKAHVVLARRRREGRR